MAYSRRLGVIGILSACWLVAAVGCSDDEDRKNNSGDAGEGGDEGGGKGGTPSGGGNANNGGKAGTAGNGGSAGSSGDAGSGTAGDAGSGSGGDAGSGGIVAGAGGEGGSGTTGGGGEGGQAIGGAGGEGGDAPAEVAKSCVDVCVNDDDCTNVDGIPKKCNEETKVCEGCSVDADCYPEISGWVGPCETTEECGDESLVCVTYQGANYCAVADGDGLCAEYEYGVIAATLAEGGDVDVCIVSATLCLEGTCTQHCDALGCAADEGDTCNATSGVCECQDGSECGTGVCVNNRCTECAIDDDCLPSLDKCVAGKCGCSDVGSCAVGPFPDATNACQ